MHLAFILHTHLWGLALVSVTLEKNVYQAKPCEYLVADAHFNFKFTLRLYI